MRREQAHSTIRVKLNPEPVVDVSGVMEGNLSEEELVIFDLLTRPAPELGTEEKAEVKKVARERTWPDGAGMRFN